MGLSRFLCGDVARAGAGDLYESRLCMGIRGFCRMSSGPDIAVKAKLSFDHARCGPFLGDVAGLGAGDYHQTAFQTAAGQYHRARLVPVIARRWR